MAVKFFPGLIAAVESAINEIFIENRKADKAIGGILKSNAKWGARDRAFIAENTYDIVRNWRKILFLAGIEDVTDFRFSQIPKVVRVFFYINTPEQADDVLFAELDKADIAKRIKKAAKDVKIEYSCPDWLWEKGKAELGEAWEAEYMAMHQKANVYIRVNSVKTTVEKLQESLLKKEIETERVPQTSTGLMLKKRMNVFGLEEFKAGNFEVQDAGSQMIAEFLDVQAGMRVIDACAGAGGKALHIATILQNKGSIIAMDIEEYKLVELKSRAKRNTFSNIDARPIVAKTIKRQHGTADRLLLDVPCSGVGVLKRNPDAKWKLRPAFMEEIKVTQAQILQEYSKMLKIGGKMVYATCSIFPSENNKQVEQFIKQNPDYGLISEQFIRPSEQGFDGYYMALLERTA
jgi:16S rRNA (cytosine967-C5)-methyltransferase